MNMHDDNAAELAQSITNARNGGYRDAYTGQSPNPPAWDTILEWSNAYAEGYALGQQAARRMKRPIQQYRYRRRT